MSAVITVENLGKKYTISHQQREQYTSLRDVITNGVALFGNRLLSPFRRSLSSCPLPHDPAVEDFWALKDVSFEVKQGDRVGIIGRNGAGKSTLLKILSRITEPTTGSIRIKGRVSSLLEVGTGFHPELTGRENIYLNGAILGMQREEIRRKFEEIVDFAEIEKFLDTPVKRYSSGMYVRLAFAVAAHLEPEILIIDEVLAVGDAQFQKKCLGKMEEVGREGRTVLFVSHNMGAIGRLCSKTIWFDSGELMSLGPSSEIIEGYLANKYDQASSREFTQHLDKTGQLIKVRLLNNHNEESTEFTCRIEPVVEITFVLRKKVRGCHLACIVTTIDGFHVFSTADTDSNIELFEERQSGQYTTRVKLPTKNLNVGVYLIAVGLGVPGVEVFDRQEAVSFTINDVGDFWTLKEGSRRAGLLVVEAPWYYQ